VGSHISGMADLDYNQRMSQTKLPLISGWVLAASSSGVFWICWRGAETRPEGPRCEARRAESRGGVLGEGAASPLPPAMGSGGAL